jgi:predicted transcriptional regulator
MESTFSARKIYHIKIRSSKAYAPNMFMNPYVYLKELSQAVRSKYDMEIIEVKYVVSKTKAQKRF